MVILLTELSSELTFENIYLIKEIKVAARHINFFESQLATKLPM